MQQTEPLFRADQVAALDARATGEFGIDGFALMQRAAAAAWQAAQRRWPAAHRITVLAGPGNNGGDGIELARLARADGCDVILYLLAEPDRLRGEAAQAWGAWQAAGGQAAPWPGELEGEIVVDALLGTGLAREVGQPFAAAIAAIQAARDAGGGVLAIDIPSGLSADTGAVLGCAVQADLTVSFIGRKLGLYTGQGPQLAGQRLFDDLSVPARLYQGAEPAAQMILPAYCAPRLPPRGRSSYKTQHGHVLCVGGDEGFAGAIRLCAEAALRAGAGLVSVGTRGAHVAAMAQARPELMVRAVEGADGLEPLLARATVIAAGPGFGRGGWAEALMPALLAAGRPMVLDADALDWLARHPGSVAGAVLTPHPGEAARLLGGTRDEVEKDRPAAVRALAEKFEAVAVLKGAGSLVTAPGEALYLCPHGNPGMAAGGMGDLLCGVIAALCGQGLSPLEAAVAGVDLHARAGDSAAADGERGLLPSDLLPAVRRLANP